ncbi:DUF3224 domain-containing protein [Pseudonocardia pini]|uniref:DUF3224 domain-containing protein n=1 Tax=Pseudonocardia pini TaxID=2758030 RepID=UPI0015F0703A|nr:DUF3224 domain-containing protein [Pseudonocardia pini]
MTHTSGGFELPTWVDTVYAEAGGETYARVSNAKVWSGGIVGESSAELITVSTASGSAAYVGIERLEVAVDGRKGTFVLSHVASGDATGGTMTVAVVPGSGTGELAGLTGTMQIDRSPAGEHTWEFEYGL